jgi:hypothetical protein
MFGDNENLAHVASPVFRVGAHPVGDAVDVRW